MSLESLVPPLEMCQQLQPGDFPESALVHEEAFWCEHYSETTGEDNSRYEHQIVVREQGNKDMKCQSAGIVLTSAPTTDEIKDELRKKYTVFSRTLMDGRTLVSLHTAGAVFSEIEANPATAALRLWMRLNGREVKG